MCRSVTIVAFRGISYQNVPQNPCAGTAVNLITWRVTALTKAFATPVARPGIEQENAHQSSSHPGTLDYATPATSKGTLQQTADRHPLRHVYSRKRKGQKQVGTAAIGDKEEEVESVPEIGSSNKA